MVSLCFDDNCLIGQTKHCVLIFVCYKCHIQFFEKIGLDVIATFSIKFPSISSIPSLQDDEEYVSYCIESSFTNILIEETTTILLNTFMFIKKLIPICLKLIFRRLLIKLATDCAFKFNNGFFKQLAGCTMEGPQSV